MAHLILEKDKIFNIQSGRAEWIIIGTGHISIGKAIHVTTQQYRQSIGGCWSEDIDWTIREATREEQEWLNACIEANKFIPLQEIQTKLNTLSYEIY